jgi:iron complex outermembrane receptor protein
MFKKKKLGTAVASIIAASLTVGNVNAQLMEEVVVTATKRSESMQDIAISVQALGGDSLKELRVETFDRYVEYLPNVVSAGNGPGQKELYIRGSATEQSSSSVSSAQGSASGVAVYVDEQPVSFGGRNLDVYAVDMERIEVLAGPQGTLFGASSQSGTVRLITNKPTMGVFEAGFNTKAAFTDGGADSTAVDAHINIPITDDIAFRAAIYSDNQGGWIDNVSATFTPKAAIIDRNSLGFGPSLASADRVDSARNDSIVEDDWNGATYNGVRLGLAYDINEDWSVLFQHTKQNLDVDGTFLTDPSLGDEETESFSPEAMKDEFGLTTWTLTGRLANLDFVYTGGFIDRDIEAVIDYTQYNNGGGYITYYLCSGNVYDATDPNNCFDPTKQYKDTSTSQRTTHEFRVSTDPDKAWRVLAGIYYNDVETETLGEFQYAATNLAFAEHVSSYHNDNSGAGFLIGQTSIDTAGVNFSGPLNAATTFSNDFTRTEDEIAFFAELAVDVTERVTLSVSARSYSLTTQLEGASNFSFGCRYGAGPNGFGDSVVTADGRCNGTGFSNDVSSRLTLLGQANASGDLSAIAASTSPSGRRDFFRGGGGTGTNAALIADIKNGFDISNIESDGSTEEEDTIYRISADWEVNDDILLFAAVSEGYRPATQNRNAGRLAANTGGVYAGYRVPTVALTDTLTNYEVGVKGEFFENTVRLNATFYRSDIEDLQVSRFDPSNVAFLVFMENVGDAEISGLDLDFQWAPTENLLVTGAMSFLDTELTKLNSQLEGVAVPVGSDLPLSSDFSGNVRVRYSFAMNTFDAEGYAQVGIIYRGENVSGIAGSAEFVEDTLFLDNGRSSGLSIQDEGGTFGTLPLSNGALPSNSRYVNEAATTVNFSAGFYKDGWSGEFFIDNLSNEEASITQVAGRFLPVVTNQRPRTMGLRFSYELE